MVKQHKVLKKTKTKGMLDYPEMPFLKNENNLFFRHTTLKNSSQKS
jgi:hypothetical protein